MKKLEDPFSKVQPQAVELEEAVIGAVLLSKDAYAEVEGVVHARMENGRPEGVFYKDVHNIIWAAISNLGSKFLPIDLLTVTEELGRMKMLEEIGGPYYLVELTSRVASSANIEYHAKIVVQKHHERQLIALGHELVRLGHDGSLELGELMSKAEKGIFGITQQGLSRGYSQVASIVASTLSKLESLKDKKDGLTGLPTGFTALDRWTCGWQPSDLIIVAARPSMGKTGSILCQALNAALDFKKPVAIFSLEMSANQLVQRLMSMTAEIPSEKLRSGKLEQSEWQQLHTQIEIISELPIYIDDTPSISLSELRSKARRMKMLHGIEAIFIDYLQLMTGERERGGNREQEVSGLSRGLKGLAKELDIPIIALSQLSRAVETRGGTKRPMLSDLREGGGIEADADVVMFLYRPEYYSIKEDENGNSLKGVAEFILAKHRNGATGTVKVKFIEQFAKFTDWEEDVWAGMPAAPPSNNITRHQPPEDDIEF